MLGLKISLLFVKLKQKTTTQSSALYCSYQLIILSKYFISIKLKKKLKHGGFNHHANWGD